jgi:hypothetical protein
MKIIYVTSFDSFHSSVETIGHFPPAGDQPHKQSKASKTITFTLQRAKRTQKKEISNNAHCHPR